MDELHGLLAAKARIMPRGPGGAIDVTIVMIGELSAAMLMARSCRRLPNEVSAGL